MTTMESNVCRLHKTIFSVIEQSFFLLFCTVSLAHSLCWINTISPLPSSSLWKHHRQQWHFVVLSSCMEITHYIHLLEVCKCFLNNHSITFPRLCSLQRAHKEDSTHHSLANWSQSALISQIPMYKATNTFTRKLVINIKEWSCKSRSCTFCVRSRNFNSLPCKLYLYELLIRPALAQYKDALEKVEENQCSDNIPSQIESVI